MLQKYFNATRERETLRSYVELNISVSCPVQGSVRVPCGARSHHSRRESVIYSLCWTAYTRCNGCNRLPNWLSRMNWILRAVHTMRVSARVRTAFGVNGLLRCRPLELPFCDGGWGRDGNRSGLPAPVAGRVGSTSGDQCVTGRRHKMQKDTFFN